MSLFLDENRAVFTPYESWEAFGDDLAYLITDPFVAFGHFLTHASHFLLYSIPLTLGLLSFNIPFMVLLSLPIALNLFTINTPVIIALIAVGALATPALISGALAVGDLVEVLLSPIVNLLIILSNSGATAIQQLPEEVSFDCSL